MNQEDKGLGQAVTQDKGIWDLSLSKPCVTSFVFWKMTGSSSVVHWRADPASPIQTLLPSAD